MTLNTMQNAENLFKQGETIFHSAVYFQYSVDTIGKRRTIEIPVKGYVCQNETNFD